MAGMGDPSIPVWGLISAAIATFVERYEFGPIDDNILITVFATAVLMLGVEVGPIPVSYTHLTLPTTPYV